MNKEQLSIWDNNHIFQICKEIALSENFEKDYRIFYKLWVLIDLLFISDPSIKQNIIDNLKWLLDEIYSNNWVINKLIQSAFLFSSLSTTWLESEEIIEEIDNIKNKAYRIAISLYYYSRLYEESSIYWLEVRNLFNNNDIIYSLFTKLWILSEIRNSGIKCIDIYELMLKDKISFSIREKGNAYSIAEYLWIEFKDKIIYLSDFQKDVLYNALFPWKSIILSAPTSAWKTFIIKQYIITKLFKAYIEDKNINICFILPTKALVNEIRLDFIKLLKAHWLENHVNVNIHLSGRDFLEKHFFTKSNLFVFTQERLNYFYTDLKYNFWYNIHFDFISVDEAHKIAYGYRGTLLSYIINEIINNNRVTQLCFMTPLIKKLSKIKNNFQLDNLNYKFSNFWLVSKNLICVRKWWRNERNFYLKINDDEEKLFSILHTKMSQPKYLAYFSKIFTNQENSSLIYRRYPMETIEQAKKISEITEDISSQDFAYLNDYIKDILSDEFELLNLLKKWIWFHNWRLPVSIRKEIEYLYKEKKSIQFLCVNSSVLEWVNLPAKNIFIWESAKDIEKFKLSRLDLKNLIGRAWRLNIHMSGNIFFIEDEEYKDKITWEDSNVEEFVGSMEKLVLNEDKFTRFLKYLTWDNYKKTISIDQKSETKDFEYMTGFLLSMYIKFWDIEFISEIRKLIYTHDKDEQIQKLKEKINTIYQDRIVNTKYNKELEHILLKNVFVDPRKQIDLYEYLCEEDWETFISMVNKYVQIETFIKIKWDNDKKRKYWMS